MKARPGVTKKISISVNRTALASLTKRAKRLYGGNVSAVIAELAADAELLERMNELVEALGGPMLTEKERARLDREWRQPARKRGGRSKKAA